MAVLKNNFLKHEAMDYVFIQLNGEEGTKIYEFDEDGEENIKDFLNMFIDGGFDNFKVYLSECNYGPFDEIASVENGEIEILG